MGSQPPVSLHVDLKDPYMQGANTHSPSDRNDPFNSCFSSHTSDLASPSIDPSDSRHRNSSYGASSHDTHINLSRSHPFSIADLNDPFSSLDKSNFPLLRQQVHFIGSSRRDSSRGDSSHHTKSGGMDPFTNADSPPTILNLGQLPSRQPLAGGSGLPSTNIYESPSRTDVQTPSTSAGKRLAEKKGHI